MKQSLQIKQRLRTTLLFLLLNTIGIGKGISQGFTANDFHFSVNNDGIRTVTITQHKSGDSYVSIPSGVYEPGHLWQSNYHYTVTRMFSGVFQGDYHVKSADIGINIELPHSTFKDCNNLEYVEFPSYLPGIQPEAFSGCSKLVQIYYTVWNDTLEQGHDTYGLPEGIINLGSSAFEGCSNLRKMKLPNSLVSIESRAFWGCSSLDSIDFPVSLASIGDEAFSNCSKLTGTLTIPSSVTSIGQFAFYGTKYSSVCFNATHCNTNGTVFGNSTIQTISIGDNVQIISNGLFAQCPSLTTVTIPNSVNFIGESAFSECTGLTSITLPNSLTSIQKSTFYLCKKLSEVTIPNTVTTIGESAFFGCEELTSIVIPNSVTTIEDYAFSGCKKLTSVTIPSSVVSVGKGVFEGCTSLTAINVDPANNHYKSINGVLYDYSEHTIIECPASMQGDYVIPNTVLTIEDNAFTNCTELTSITIPTTVTTIGTNAFQNCKKLAKINYNAINCDLDETWLTGCSALSQIIFGGEVKIIPKSAFKGCDKIVSLILPNSLDSIGVSAFQNCIGLASIILPNALEKLEDQVFEGCASLTEINIPNSVTTIGSSAFRRCSSLSKITIPSSVSSIGRGAFSNCVTLKELVFNAENCTIENNIWNGCDSINSLTIGERVKAIPNSAFANLDGLTVLFFPNSVETIGENAFSDCDGLTSVIIPNSVKTIGKGSFSDCQSLTTVAIGSSVESIGMGAFSGCSRLNMLYYNVKKDLVAGNNVFSNCPNLSTIHIGQDVEEIGSNIFKGCNTVHFVVALGPTPAVLDAGAFSDIVDNSVLMVSCGNRITYFSVWNMFPFNNIIEDCNTYAVESGVAGNGGNVSLSQSAAQMGSTVQISVTPNPGMRLASLTVCNVNDPTQIIPVTPDGKATSSYSFVMPPFGVVVTATFVTSTAVNEINHSLAAKVYPNPTSGLMKIEAENLRHISIFNTTGQQVYYGNAEGNVFEYDFGRCQAGIYLIQIQTTTGTTVKRVVVTR